MIGLIGLSLLAGILLIFHFSARSRTIGEDIGLDVVRISQARELIDPNTASVASLRRLVGIGPAKAQAIVDFRLAHGPIAFKHPGDLKKVRGIGPAIVGKISYHLNFPSSRSGSTRP